MLSTLRAALTSSLSSYGETGLPVTSFWDCNALARGFLLLLGRLGVTSSWFCSEDD